MQNVPGGWRYTVGATGIPAIFLGFAVYFNPDTPRCLIQKERIEEATAVIHRIYPNATDLQVNNKVKLVDSTFIQLKFKNHSFKLSQNISQRWIISAVKNMTTTTSKQLPLKYRFSIK